MLKKALEMEAAEKAVEAMMVGLSDEVESPVEASKIKNQSAPQPLVAQNKSSVSQVNQTK